jgi:hypothetical protein
MNIECVSHVSNQQQPHSFCQNLMISTIGDDANLPQILWNEFLPTSLVVIFHHDHYDYSWYRGMGFSSEKEFGLDDYGWTVIHNGDWRNKSQFKDQVIDQWADLAEMLGY